MRDLQEQHKAFEILSLYVKSSQKGGDSKISNEKLSTEIKNFITECGTIGFDYKNFKGNYKLDPLVFGEKETYESFFYNQDSRSKFYNEARVELKELEEIHKKLSTDSSSSLSNSPMHSIEIDSIKLESIKTFQSSFYETENENSILVWSIF